MYIMSFIKHFQFTHGSLKQLAVLLKVREIHTRTLKYDQAYINGMWVDASNGMKFEVLNPSNGTTVGVVPNMGVEDCQSAIEAAKIAFDAWQGTTAKERSKLLRNWYDVLSLKEKELAEIITLEAGKPLTESRTEVQYGNSFVEWYSEEARRVNGEVLCSPTKTKEMILIKQPIGVAALITPWNFPLAMITRKAAAALAAGCTCVVKPAEDTPLTALALADTAEQAGFPKGVFNVVTCDRAGAPAVGRLICESPSVAGISFTGSTDVGKLLYQQCSNGVKRIGLELGGNAPFIVFNSANVIQAVRGAMAAKFRNCGQACVSANRFLIQDEIFDLFISRLKSQMEQELILGDGFDPKTNLGPLITKHQALKVNNIVEDAVGKGAQVHLGGRVAEHIGPGFFEPTLLTHVDDTMDCYREEIFGPVAVCIKFKYEDEAVAIANDSKRGLAGYFYSEDISQAWRVARKLAVGMVGINEGIISAAEAAFGGIKESGIGREGSHHGIDEYVYLKYLCFGNL